VMSVDDRWVGIFDQVVLQEWYPLLRLEPGGSAQLVVDFRCTDSGAGSLRSGRPTAIRLSGYDGPGYMHGTILVPLTIRHR
jgi:hypothetical protein